MYSDTADHKAQPPDLCEMGGIDNPALRWPSDFRQTGLEKLGDTGSVRNTLLRMCLNVFKSLWMLVILLFQIKYNIIQYCLDAINLVLVPLTFLKLRFTSNNGQNSHCAVSAAYLQLWNHFLLTSFSRT